MASEGALAGEGEQSGGTEPLTCRIQLDSVRIELNCRIPAGMQKCLVWDKYPHIWYENSEGDSGMTVKENHRKSCFFLLILSVKEKGRRTLSNNRGFINYGKFMAKLLYSHSK